MQIPKSAFESQSAIRSLILDCEAAFSASMSSCIETLSLSENHTLLLSGPSCSGKTTATARIAEAYRTLGKKLHTISVDDFYRSREVLQPRNPGTLPDYESFDAIDGEYLEQCIDEIYSGREAKLPSFSFQLGRRSHCTPYQKSNDETVMFEGIHTIYPEFRNLMEAYSIKHHLIYICPTENIDYGSISFTPLELRFMRRIVRDLRTRGATPEFTAFLWRGVVENEEKNMIPNSHFADIHIDTALGYEPFMIRDRFLSAQSLLPSSSPQKAFATGIAEKLQEIPSITDEFLPRTSIFSEFIG